MVGLFGLGLTMEIAGMLNRRQPNFDRLARNLARATVLMYSTGAVIAIIFFIVVTLLFPTFWFVIIRINFWPMFLEGFTFVLTILFLFPWYYTWGRLARFKGVHVSLALALWYVAQLQQSMVDVMAGYMLVASPELCRRFAILNLHPALPGGPKGTWQDVIWELLEAEAEETGAMIHLATAQLDRGPVVAFFRLPLRGPDWDPLWEQWHAKRATRSVVEIAADEGEDEPLFAEIRRRGEVREIPLLYQALRQFADGKLNTANGCVFAESTRLPLDVTDLVEAEVAEG
jgi:folate-dependent phosphoribosylglycinamide formyltransferase PurN